MRSASKRSPPSMSAAVAWFNDGTGFIVWFETVMRLAAKLVLLYLVGLLLIVGLFSYLTVRQERRIAMAEHQRHAADIAAAIRSSVEEATRDDADAGRDGENTLERIVTRSTREIRHVRLRWVDLHAVDDGRNRPSVPVEMIVAKSEVTTIRTTDSSGQDTLYTYVPIEDGERSADNDDGLRLEVSAPDKGASERFRQSVASSLIALLGVAALSGVVILVGGVLMVGQPLEELIAKVQRVGRGDFGDPVKPRSHDELGRLATALNDMCDQLSDQRSELDAATSARIATLEQLRHSDRLNAVGRMAAGIAHEIGTPLNVVSGRAELIADGQLSEDASRESALAIKTEAERIAKTIRGLLDFARQSSPHPQTQPLGDIIEVTANLMEPLAAKQGATIRIELPSEPLTGNVDAGQLQQVLTNLTINAIQSTSGDGRVTVALSNVLTRHPDHPAEAESPYRKIAISDNGSGIAREDLEHIFEPFFTTKDVGDGTGLGLSISHGIVHEHGGWIEVESEPGEGSCFSIYLPAPAEESFQQDEREHDEGGRADDE